PSELTARTSLFSKRGPDRGRSLELSTQRTQRVRPSRNGGWWANKSPCSNLKKKLGTPSEFMGDVLTSAAVSVFQRRTSYPQLSCITVVAAIFPSAVNDPN